MAGTSPLYLVSSVANRSKFRQSVFPWKKIYSDLVAARTHLGPGTSDERPV